MPLNEEKQEDVLAGDDKSEELLGDKAGWSGSGLLKAIGSLAGVLAVLAGIRVNIDTLKEKSIADLNAEKTKLQIADLTSKDHQKDVDLQRDIHAAEFQRQKDIAASTANQQLADIITRMFGTEEHSEGELAVLFASIDQDTKRRDVLLNAVVTRLESPRSREEIDLCFRLFQRIGYPATPFVVEANRSARKRYDDYLFERFRRLFSSYHPLPRVEDQPETEKRLPEEIGADRTLKLERAEWNATSGTSLDPHYGLATINQRLEHGIPEDNPEPEKVSSNEFMRQELAADVIVRSQDVMMLCNNSRNHSQERHRIDLDGTYLTNAVIPFSSEDFNFKSNTFASEHFIRMTESLMKSKNEKQWLWPGMRVKSENLKCDEDPTSCKFFP